MARSLNRSMVGFGRVNALSMSKCRGARANQSVMENDGSTRVRSRLSVVRQYLGDGPGAILSMRCKKLRRRLREMSEDRAYASPSPAVRKMDSIAAVLPI